jgi:hypothetical protein
VDPDLRKTGIAVNAALAAVTRNGLNEKLYELRIQVC